MTTRKRPRNDQYRPVTLRPTARNRLKNQAAHVKDSREALGRRVAEIVSPVSAPTQAKTCVGGPEQDPDVQSWTVVLDVVQVTFELADGAVVVTGVSLRNLRPAGQCGTQDFTITVMWYM